MNASFHENLCALRKERQITQKQAAADLGVSQALLSHYEKGIRECGLDFLTRAADYYNVTIDYLLGHQISYTQKENSIRRTSAPSPLELQERHYNSATKLLLQILHRCEKTTLAKVSLNIMCCWLYFGLRYLLGCLPGDNAVRKPTGANMIQTMTMTLTQFSMLAQIIHEIDPKLLPDVSDEKLKAQYPDLYDDFRIFVKQMEQMEDANREAQTEAILKMLHL